MLVWALMAHAWLFPDPTKVEETGSDLPREALGGVTLEITPKVFNWEFSLLNLILSHYLSSFLSYKITRQWLKNEQPSLILS